MSDQRGSLNETAANWSWLF